MFPMGMGQLGAQSIRLLYIVTAYNFLDHSKNYSIILIQNLLRKND